MTIRSARRGALCAASILALLALVALTSACEPDSVGVETPDAGDVTPLVPVELPKVPEDLGQSVVPEKHADGSLTVNGLRRNRLEHLDTDLAIKGYIVWIYECPYAEEVEKRRLERKKKKEVEEGKEEENLCQRDHFYIADTPKGEERLLVVGVSTHLQELFEKGTLKIDEQYTFQGKYADIGDGFAAPDEGLLHLGIIKGFEPEVEEEKP